MAAAQFLLAAGDGSSFLAELAILLVGGAAIAYAGARLGLVPIVSFLLAGVLIGPNSLGVITDQEVVDAAAEAGVILLLFTIGMQFSLDRLVRLWREIFLGGGLQVGLTTAASVAVLLALDVPVKSAIYTGLLVALSSTALVLRLLSDRGETSEPHGEASVGLLLFQDLAIIPMVLIVPMLGTSGGSGAEIAAALAIAVGIIATVLIFARRLMPPLLEVVARTCSPEIFLITVIAICFGTAYLTSLAGVSVSLGAFLAGLLVHESRFGQHALSEILPLQIIFSATFFVSIGMLLDLGFVADNIPLVLGAAAGVLVIKTIATGVSVRALGYAVPVAGAAALLLAQVGEFSFVLEQVGRDEGLTPGDLGSDGTQTLIATTVLLMAATPALATLGRRFAGLDPPELAEVPDDGRIRASGVEPDHDLSGHVILAGYGDGARAAVPALRSAGLEFVITTLNPGGAREAIAEGLPVIQGDHTKARLLERAGIASARLVVIADDELETTYRVASVAKGLNPGVEILARVPEDEDVAAIAAAGVDRVISGPRAAAGRLPYAILHQCDVAAEARLDPDRVVRVEPVGELCEHGGEARPVRARAPGCESCLRQGEEWVHLRICLVCGHVGCCDSSPHKHAAAHYAETGHALIVSAEPGEAWAYCYVDRETFRTKTPARPGGGGWAGGPPSE